MNFPRDLPGPVEMASRLARIEVLLMAVLERLEPTPEPEPQPDAVPPLVLALGAAFGASGFTSREAWHRACTPDGALWVALETEGIKGIHHLGHWLGRHKGAGIVQTKDEREGKVWHCDLARFAQTD